MKKLIRPRRVPYSHVPATFIETVVMMLACWKPKSAALPVETRKAERVEEFWGYRVEVGMIQTSRTKPLCLLLGLGSKLWKSTSTRRSFCILPYDHTLLRFRRKVKVKEWTCRLSIWELNLTPSNKREKYVSLLQVYREAYIYLQLVWSMYDFSFSAYDQILLAHSFCQASVNCDWKFRRLDSSKNILYFILQSVTEKTNIVM